MLDCLDNGFYHYPISHVLLPMMVYYFYDHGFNGVLFSVFAATLWELLEVFVVSFFNSYVIFGDSLGPIGGGTESLCNAVFLDIGNGILGAFLAWATNKGTLKTTFKYWVQLVIFLFVGLLYSYLSGHSWYCSWDPDCDKEEMVDFPWGNLLNIILLTIWIYFCFDDGFWIWINVMIISIMGTIPYISSAFMVYIGTVLCFIIQVIRNEEIKTILTRTSRSGYEIIPS